MPNYLFFYCFLILCKASAIRKKKGQGKGKGVKPGHNTPLEIDDKR